MIRFTRSYLDRLHQCYYLYLVEWGYYDRKDRCVPMVMIMTMLWPIVPITVLYAQIKSEIFFWKQGRALAKKIKAMKNNKQI